MHLIGTGLSPYVQRVMLAARHKRIELPLQQPEGGTRSPQHLAINPMGKMPVLVDGDLVLPESEVILDYLEDRIPSPTLFPGSTAERAQVRLLARLQDTYGAPSFNCFIVDDGPAIETALQRIDDSLRYLEHFWRPARHAAGEAFSAADCALIPIFSIYERLPPRFGVPDRVAAHPKLAAWWQRSKASEPGKFALATLDEAVKALLGA